MKVFNDSYNLIAGGIVTILSAVFGIYWYVFAAYMILNIIDWITGWWKSRKLKQESSVVGLKGILKKLGYWIIIAVAFLMSDVFVRLGVDILKINLDFLMLIGWFTLACLMVNEVRSILENLVELGYAVPKVLIEGLEITEKLINKKAEENTQGGSESENNKEN
jgi:toxin secretion/phage lysis holin